MTQSQKDMDESRIKRLLEKLLEQSDTTCIEVIKHFLEMSEKSPTDPVTAWESVHFARAVIVTLEESNP